MKVGAGQIYGGTFGSDGVLFTKLASRSQPSVLGSLHITPFEAEM
jgi:hypothetical protein